jgi:thiamine-phosphate pyrophosphorylase
MKSNIDYTLYLVTDQQLSYTNIEEAIEQAILGGCTMVQLREKEQSSLAFYQLACQVRDITTRYNIPLIINDRVDIAYGVDADGVHLGQSDVPYAVARKLLGSQKIIGISVSNLKEAKKAVQEGADYLGVGAMFTTNTKIDANLTSMEELRIIRNQIDIPLVVIGGINKETISLFQNMDIDGLAVVSAILAQENPKQATRELKTMFMEMRK